MIVIPPGKYIIVKNPVLRDEDGSILMDNFGMPKLAWGDEEVKLDTNSEAFPLYPGELWDKQIMDLQIVPANSALKLSATKDFYDEENKVERKNGSEWWFEGPGTYIPRVGVKVEEREKAVVIQPGQAIHLRATADFRDRLGIDRVIGEEWHYTKPGAYIPDIDEKLVERSVIEPLVLTDTLAVHLKAVHKFTDVFGTVRYPGDEWLITREQEETHITPVYAQKVAEVRITTLTRTQYAVIQNPVNPDTGRPEYGKKIIRRGECSFFLQPGEILEKTGYVHILNAYTKLWVQALVNFEDTTTEAGAKTPRKAGEKWIIFGPKEYLPPLEVAVLGGPQLIVTYGKHPVADLLKHVVLAFIVLVTWWVFL